MYVDVDGHPQQPALSRALEELSFFSKELEIVGVYPAANFRITNIRAFDYIKKLIFLIINNTYNLYFSILDPYNFLKIVRNTYFTKS